MERKSVILIEGLGDPILSKEFDRFTKLCAEQKRRLDTFLSGVSAKVSLEDTPTADFTWDGKFFARLTYYNEQDIDIEDSRGSHVLVGWYHTGQELSRRLKKRISDEIRRLERLEKEIPIGSCN